MKFSAKFTTVSFLAAAAIGAGAFVFGCTVTSGTVDEDGGPPVTPTGDSGTTTDAGGGDSAATCSLKAEIAPVGACRTCLAERCCAEQQACVAITPTAGDAGGTDDCAKHATCRQACAAKSGPDQAACEDDCRFLAGAGVAEAYDAVLQCALDQNCGSTCGVTQSDIDAGSADAADQ